jgi:hypothetical protein
MVMSYIVYPLLWRLLKVMKKVLEPNFQHHKTSDVVTHRRSYNFSQNQVAT